MKNSLNARGSVFPVEKRFSENGLDYHFPVIDSIYRQITNQSDGKIYTPTILYPKRSEMVMIEEFGQVAGKTGEKSVPYPICKTERQIQEFHARRDDSCLNEQPAAAIVESLHPIARCRNSLLRRILEISTDSGYRANLSTAFVRLK